MKRSVIQIANSTQLISLPRKWSQKYNIQKGDELEVEEQGNKIYVGTDKSQEAGNIEVNITDLDRDSFMFLIRSLYIRGYNEIKLVFNNPLTMHHRIGKKVTFLSQIHEEVNRLTGIEIIQQKENFCVLKVLSESSIKDFDLIFRRIFLLLTDASNDLVTGAVKGDKYLIESIEEKHNTITKFMASALRLLNKTGHPDYKNTPLFYYIIESLDAMNDILKETARSIISSKSSISKGAENIIAMINGSLQDFSKLFYKFDFKLVEKLSSERYKILRDVQELSKKSSKDEIEIVMNMERIIEVIYKLKVTRIALEH